MGFKHSFGAEVDITLVDKDGGELEMPSEFDEFSYKSDRNNRAMSKEAKKNMEYLTEVMKQSGFLTKNHFIS